MQVSNCTKEDFDQILDNFNFFWEGDDLDRLIKIRYLHHPMMIYELGDNAFVIRINGQIAAYLLGLFSCTEPVGYVQFIATHCNFRRRGFASLLYEHFAAKAKEQGCKRLKAITSPHNHNSISFHKSLGMGLQGEPNEDGVPVVRNYAGPGQDRVVFLKTID